MRATQAGHRTLSACVKLLAAVGISVSVLSGSTAHAAAAPIPPQGWAKASAIDAFVKKERAELKLSGVAVVVLYHGEVFFERGYGDAVPGGPAVTLTTPFLLGSTSKQFTGLAVQQLIAQGRLSLDDTVGTLLRPLGGRTSPFSAVTVAQLLSHESGISTDVGTADVFDPTPEFTALRAEGRQVLQSAPASKPGTRFEYSNGNYTLLGLVLQEVTGLSFERALQSLVAEPLGLHRTTSDLALAQKSGLAVGHYTWFGAIDSTTPGPQWPMGAPSAYTTSTAADLARLLQAELGRPSGMNSAVFAAAQAPLAKVDDYNRYASGGMCARSGNSTTKTPTTPTRRFPSSTSTTAIPLGIRPILLSRPISDSGSSCSAIPGSAPTVGASVT